MQVQRKLTKFHSYSVMFLCYMVLLNLLSTFKLTQLISVKVIRNKQTGQSERYGFVEFSSHAAADKVLQSYNGSPMPNTEQVFHLNWAAFSMGNRRQEAGAVDLSIFVGDLAAAVPDSLLHETFASRFPSVKGAKVVVDPNTGRSKGYGFVRFADEKERTQAMTEMNGAYCSSRPMRIGVATPKKASPQQQYSSQGYLLDPFFKLESCSSKFSCFYVYVLFPILSLLNKDRRISLCKHLEVKICFVMFFILSVNMKVKTNFIVYN